MVKKRVHFVCLLLIIPLCCMICFSSCRISFTGCLDKEKERMDNVDKELAEGKDFAEVAKKYSEETAPAFINGVLDKVLKEVE